MNLTPIYLCAQPNATYAKYTSAQPFTPKFVNDHLGRDSRSNTATPNTKKLPSFRAQALYDERVRRRQLGLARRIQGQRAKATKAEKEKKKGVVKREKMGRRQAAEMGVWRLRREEARCVPERIVAVQCTPCLSYWFLKIYFRWDAFVPLHRLWLGYMSELLGLTVATVDTLGQGQGQEGRTAHAHAHAMKAAAAAMPSAAGMQAKLVKADFHGSIMSSRSFLYPPVSECLLFC